MSKLVLNDLVKVSVLVVFPLPFQHATFEQPPTAALILAPVDAFLRPIFVDHSAGLHAADTILEATLLFHSAL